MTTHTDDSLGSTDVPTVEGLMELARQYAHAYFNTYSGDGQRAEAFMQDRKGKLEAYARRLASLGSIPAGEAGEHRQGCEALGGYGHGVGPCTCGAVPSPAPVAAVRMLTSEEIDKLVQDSAMIQDSARGLIKRTAYKTLEVNGLTLGAAAPAGGETTLSDEQCDAIYDALHNWAMDVDQYDFGLPQVSGGGKEGGREVIRRALLSAGARHA
jgi:hypothetical protein